MHGQGKMIHPNGEVYEGTFDNDKAEGLGKFLNKKGELY